MKNDFIPEHSLKLLALRLLQFAAEESQGKFAEPYNSEIEAQMQFEAQQFFERAKDGKDDKVWFDILGIQPTKCLEYIEAGDHLW